MTENQLVQAVAEVIAKRAGFYQQVRKGLPQPLAIRLNNPGLLQAEFPDGRPTPSVLFDVRDERSNLFSVRYPVSHGYVEYPDVKTGWNALFKYTRNRVCVHRCTARDLFRGRDDGEYLEMVTRFFSIHAQEPLITLLGGTSWPTQMKKPNTGSINSMNLKSVNA